MSLVPTPSEQAETKCATCGAELVADQRYCLACGHPASPVRLAFLDVLQPDNGYRPQRADAWSGAATIEMGAGGYAPPPPQAHGVSGWLGRYSGLLALLSVLALCLLAGLLVGHWATQGKVPGKQVIEVKGLAGAPAAAAATPASTTPTGTTPAGSASNAKAEAEEAKAEKKESAVEKAPPPAPVKVAPAKIKKLSTTTGKKHQEEINALGAQPIETGG
ncbi:MAG TPA: hypothetical protein VGI27_05810 [Solirubrobacteraceae bacterium]